MTETSTLRAELMDMFTTTVNAVDDLGWDPTGQTPITVPFNDNTLIEVPVGDYLIDTAQSGVVNAWGLIGLGANPTDVRFIPPVGTGLRGFQTSHGSDNVLVENVTLHQRDTIEGAIGSAWHTYNRLLLNDVHWTGIHPGEQTSGGSASLCNFYVKDAAGVGIFDGLDISDPTELVTYPYNATSFFTGAGHEGVAYVRNSRFENRGSSGMYTSRCAGDIRVENCVFKNNQNSQLRISGEGSYAKDSEFIWDITDHPNIGDFDAQTGLTFESGENGFTGGLVERCEFRVVESAPNSGCLKVDGSHGGITVRDCAFDIPDNVPPVNIEAPGDSHMITGLPSEPWDCVLDKVHVTSSGGTDNNSDSGVKIVERDRSKLVDCCILATDRHALRTENGVYGIEGGNIESTNMSRFVGSGEVYLTDVGTEASCSLSVATLPADDTGGDPGGGGTGTDPGKPGDPSTDFWDQWLTPHEGIWASVESADGGTNIEFSDILGGTIEHRHTAISTADIEIPPREITPGLVLGHAEVFYDEGTIFAGEIHTVPGPASGSDPQTLTIRGPAARLDGGDLTLVVENQAAHDVIEAVWAEHTDFEFTVHEPPADRVVYLGAGDDDETGEPVAFETEGTVLNILQDLHERAGMRFTVHHDESSPEQGVVESYVPGTQTREATWESIDHKSHVDPEGYANRVTVYGRKPDDPTETRPQWTADDYDEQDIYGVYPRPGGVVIYDAELTESADCREKAEAVLDEMVDEISVSGPVEITPHLVYPGYHYTVPEFDAVLNGDTLPLSRLSLAFLGDNPTATLEFGKTNSFTDKLVELSRKANRANRLL